MTLDTPTDIDRIRLLRRHLPPRTPDAMALAARLFDGVRREGYLIVKAEADPELVAKDMIEMLQHNGYTIIREQKL